MKEETPKNPKKKPDKSKKPKKKQDRVKNFKGQVGRPRGRGKTLTPNSKAFIEGIYLEGLPMNLAYKQAGYKSAYHTKRAKEILDSEAAQEYIGRLQNNDTAKLQASKSYLIKNLVSRLDNASDANAVNIIKQISNMLGYQVSKDIDDININSKIEIEWKPLIDFDADAEEAKGK